MYEVYATRWDDAHIVEELIPAHGLEFTLPLSDHGECSFSATVEPRRSFWRPALSCAMSGILVCRDGVPQWSGQMLGERQSGPRTFDFTFAEWGSFFETCPAVPLTLVGANALNDHALQRRLISDAQAIAGQDVGIILGTTTGATVSELTINAWDTTTVEEEFRRLGEHAGGPEWYVNTTGTLENPTRTLVQGDRLGSVDPVAVLEYVEDTQDWVPPEAPPVVTLLGSLFPGAQPYAVIGGRRGGNVISQPARQQSPGITVAVAVGAGDQLAQIRKSAPATALLNAGYPRKTKTTSYTDVKIPATLQRHADADLAAGSGMTTVFTLTTFEDDPDWTGVARGDTVRVELDSDVYATERPLVFNSRVLDRAIHVPDDGKVQVNWVLADVRDY
jgi:hypothetical protein